MSASEMRQQINEIGAIALHAIANAEEAANAAKMAIMFIKHVSDKLSESRNSALRHAQKLDEMLHILRQVTRGTENMDALIALSQYEAARERMVKYTQLLKYQIEKIDAIIAVLQLGVAQEELVQARTAFLSGTEALSSFGSSL